MNRRESLKALAVGSVGAVTPFVGWNNVPFKETMPVHPGNFSADPAGEVEQEASRYTDAKNTTIHLVADKNFIDVIAASIGAGMKPMDRNAINSEALLNGLASGEAMVWIGSPEDIPKELSVGAFRISESKVAITIPGSSPLSLKPLTFQDGLAFSAFISPPKEMPNHNIDEEVRADFIPILEARDRFGNLVGYPGLLMSYFAPSLAKRRFKGSECFFFLFDNPLECLAMGEWRSILTSIYTQRQSGLQVTDYNTDFASYKPGERVHIRARVNNRRHAAVSVLIKYSIKMPGSGSFMPLMEMRRVPEGGSDTEAVSNFRPEAKPGLWTLRLQVLQDVKHAEQLPFDGTPAVIDQRDIGFMMVTALSTPVIFSIKGPAIMINNEEGFWAGTHYYPSTSWWEWVWRDFRPLKAAEDLAAIRRSGYRIVRVWIDPVIDETVLRAIDSAILLASENGIVLDICVFTQWARQMGFERANGKHILFDYRGKRDFNVVSFSLRNLDLQREFVQIIGSRWKNAGNIFYDLANEVYIKDPDATQMDAEAANWKGIPSNKSVVRDSLLFRRWGNEMTAAIRKAGGKQTVFPGYMFSTAGGGDVYVGNADAPIVSWHSYAPTDQTALTLSYFDPISSGRPILLEELGVLGWNNAPNYDGTAHYALAAGAAGAMSYEWGVSWLARESCFWPLPLRDAIVDDPDPRWFPPYVTMFKAWPDKGVGLCPTPSGTGYGSVYHGTPFPAAAAVALGRVGLMGKGLQRVVKPETTYVIVPSTQLDAIKPYSEIVKGLWSAKVLFGIWQETDLGKLPASTKVIVCPAPLSGKSAGILEGLRRRGVKIYNGTSEWKASSELEKVIVTPEENVDLLMRRTEKGRLFTLISKKGPLELTYNNTSVKLGISDFALVHISMNGVVLLEGEGDISVNNIHFCTVGDGRLVVASEDDLPLTQTKRLRLMVTKPTRLRFSRAIAYVGWSDGFNKKPSKAPGTLVSGSELVVDDELVRYVIHVTFR